MLEGIDSTEYFVNSDMVEELFKILPDKRYDRLVDSETSRLYERLRFPRILPFLFSESTEYDVPYSGDDARYSVSLLDADSWDCPFRLIPA